ncbi:Gfo/Idh/MocA family protein [Roseisalinus antarcticus]|uniref:1,5-anhydro-D-fructose reductase n=1 Tax=Roseisalinus antarcticus TaxID=254357 RepID=A0A1Y5TKJ9_9RHOB|nr:Gfo/Idh/MocA family oxidoreductase [Roseisalinus antarcticus]SLN66072.1 1,5-anhydro-D-fructose reductase [Roseisalinus antarcticus]
MSDLRVLILGTGGMANAHAEAYAAMPGVTLAAGVDTNPGRLLEFNALHRIEHGFRSVEEAIAWGRFDAVSNVTPDPVHHATTLALLAAGKHVLCEKPLATTAEDAEEMARAAAAAGVVNMVNLSYRNVPALIQAHAMVAAGEIGEIRHFEAAYLQSWLTQDAWGQWDEDEKWLWRLSTAHGSMGVLGDIGVHILDFATYAAGGLGVRDVSCRLTTFDKAPGGRIGDYVLDANDSFAMHMALENGAVGVVHASRMATGHLNDLSLRLFGSKGGLDVRFEGGRSILRACLGEADMHSGTWREMPAPEVPTNYVRFIAAVRSGAQVLPDFARGAALQRVMDRAVDSDAAGGAKLTV